MLLVSLVHAFVLSRLDYCSSIFAGLPGVLVKKPRRVHPTAALLSGDFKKFAHISQLLYERCNTLTSIPATHLLQDRAHGVPVLVCLPSLFFSRPSHTEVLCSR